MVGIKTIATLGLIGGTIAGLIIFRKEITGGFSQAGQTLGSIPSNFIGGITEGLNPLLNFKLPSQESRGGNFRENLGLGSTPSPAVNPGKTPFTSYADTFYKNQGRTVPTYVPPSNPLPFQNEFPKKEKTVYDRGFTPTFRPPKPTGNTSQIVKSNYEKIANSKPAGFNVRTTKKVDLSKI